MRKQLLTFCQSICQPCLTVIVLHKGEPSLTICWLLSISPGHTVIILSQGGNHHVHPVDRRSVSPSHTAIVGHRRAITYSLSVALHQPWAHRHCSFTEREPSRTPCRSPSVSPGLMVIVLHTGEPSLTICQLPSVSPGSTVVILQWGDNNLLAVNRHLSVLALQLLFFTKENHHLPSVNRRSSALAAR